MRSAIPTGTESESDFASWLEALLNLRGWRWCHYTTAINLRGNYRTALRGHKGAPDYHMVRDGVFLVAELKSQTGALAPEQLAWRRALAAAGVRYYCWRPGDRAEIEEILA